MIENLRSFKPPGKNPEFTAHHIEVMHLIEAETLGFEHEKRCGYLIQYSRVG
jgi:hypothetical protein